MASFIKAPGLAGVTAVDNSFIADYMPKAPEGYVKAYLFGLMLANLPDPGDGDLAAPLSMDGDALSRAFAYWQAEGLVRLVSASPLTVEYLPVRPASGGEAPRKYASLVAALTEAAGTRIFSGYELGEIYGWIETFRFDEGTAVLCVTDTLARSGPRAKLWQMNANARLWADNGVFTEADACAFIEKRAAVDEGAKAILRRWRQFRAPTEDEEALYRKWTEEWHIDPAVVSDACAESTGASKPSFAYLDAVLKGYKESGRITVEASAAARREQDALVELARAIFERAKLKSIPTAEQRAQIERWRNAWFVDAELLFLAADAASSVSQPFAYMRKLISDWHEGSISTLAAATADLERRRTAAPVAEAAKRSRALNHAQRKYSEDDLKNIGVDLLGG